MGYVVTAPLAIVRTSDGKMIHLYDGQIIPQHAEADDLKRLHADGFIARSNEAAPTAVVVDGVEKPAGNATHGAWAAYAIETGQATKDDLKGLTRDELRDLYG